VGKSKTTLSPTAIGLVAVDLRSLTFPLITAGMGFHSGRQDSR